MKKILMLFLLTASLGFSANYKVEVKPNVKIQQSEIEKNNLEIEKVFLENTKRDTLEGIKEVDNQIAEQKDELGARFFGEILKDFERTDFAYQAIKKISNLCEHIESVEFFEILLKVFRSLNDFEISLDLVRKWFILKIAEFSGDEINLETDKNGTKLQANLRYEFDFYDKVFVESFSGKFDANDIKFLRLMVSSEPKVVSKIKGCDIFLNKIEEIIPRF